MFFLIFIKNQNKMDAIIDEYPSKPYFNQYIYDKALEYRAQLTPYYNEFVANNWKNPIFEGGLSISTRNKVYFYYLICSLLDKSALFINSILEYMPNDQLDKDLLYAVLNNKNVIVEIEDLQHIASMKETVYIDDYFQKMVDNFKLQNSIDIYLTFLKIYFWN